MKKVKGGSLDFNFFLKPRFREINHTSELDIGQIYEKNSYEINECSQ
jgi:hypothetical protein